MDTCCLRIWMHWSISSCVNDIQTNRMFRNKNKDNELNLIDKYIEKDLQVNENLMGFGNFSGLFNLMERKLIMRIVPRDNTQPTTENKTGIN